MDIKLNLVNQSNDQNNSEIVIFQKNVATNFEEIAVAWTVIENLGQGSHHPFTYPMASTIAYTDSWGNYTPQLDAAPGQLFAAVRTHSGDEITLKGSANSPAEIALVNDLPQGAIDALVYKAGRLLASKTGVSPGQQAVFEFTPTIWIGVVSQVEQGQAIDTAILSDINTEISLLGIASADIVMTGGGVGPARSPSSSACRMW